MDSTAARHVARWNERLTLPRAVATIVCLATTLVLVGALLACLAEPETFTSYGLACWWALTTVTTVGYGDVVPQELPGRLVGAVLMLTGLSLIPTLTSVIISLLAAKRTRLQLDQARRFQAENAARLERIEQTLGRIER